jgi:hypothetical protein
MASIRPPIARSSALLLALSSLIALSACDAGGSSKTSGGGGSGGTTLLVDFGMAKDVLLGKSFLADVFAADLNGDGIQDLCEANFASKQVTIAFGNADGTFTVVFELATLGTAWRMLTTDVDGDGLMDVVAACGSYGGAGTSSVHALLQGPAGSFTTNLSLVLADDPLDAAAIPASGVAGAAGPNELFLALRDAFQIARVSLVGGALVQTGTLDSSVLGNLGGPYSVAAIDLGGDGKVDLAVGEQRVANGDPDRVITYPNLGTSMQIDFGAPSVAAGAVSQPLVDAVGDVDGNGFEDLAVAQLSGATEALVLPGGPAGLGAALAIEFEGAQSSLVLSDLNADGLSDVVGTAFDHSAVLVRLGTGPLTWGDATRYQVGYLPRAIGVTQLAGDAIPDLICSNAFDISILPGLGAGRFRGARGFPTLAAGPTWIETADFDNDGDLDCVAAAELQDSISFLAGSGNGELEIALTLPLVPTVNETPGHLAVADIDGNGFLDVLTSVQQTNELRLYRNTSGLTSFHDPIAADVHSVGNSPVGVAAADFDGDLLIDAVVCNTVDGTIQVLLNLGGGELSVQAPIDIGLVPAAIKAMDFDLDGDVDLALSTGEVATAEVPSLDKRFQVFANDGTGLFELAFDAPLDTLCTSLAMGDLDDDGQVDLVAGQNGNGVDRVWVFRNLGGLAFDALAVTVGADPNVVLVADADDDGRLDLVVPSGAGELKFLFGDGLGGFAAAFPAEAGALTAPFQLQDADWADLDEDGLPDLVLVSPDEPLVWVGLNSSTAIPSP